LRQPRRSLPARSPGPASPSGFESKFYLAELVQRRATAVKSVSMFHQIPQAMLFRMRELEQIDLRDRTDGTSHRKRLRQIPSEVGKLLALLMAAAPAGPCIEIGTSAGYSTMWLALACRAIGRTVTTFEIDDQKVELARATFAAAGVTDIVELVHGDALNHLPAYQDIGFCFLDAEKDLYDPCYDLVVPRMVSGGILVADNAISHEAELRPMLDRALRDERIDAVLVPIGTGDLICRKK
jgi:caffeoyl-CoA O-methyltransferase